MKKDTHLIPDQTIIGTSSLLNISPTTIYSLLNKGLLIGYKIGRSRRITGESIARLRSGKWGGNEKYYK